MLPGIVLVVYGLLCPLGSRFLAAADWKLFREGYRYFFSDVKRGSHATVSCVVEERIWFFWWRRQPAPVMVRQFISAPAASVIMAAGKKWLCS